jgi:CRP/FNR family transcriptional regulator, cyclic AMP receptor protein
MQFRNGIVSITREKHCPLYNVGEILQLDEGILKLPVAKPTCLTLAKDLIALASEGIVFEEYFQGSKQKTEFECGGCTGSIRFEFKKEKECATIQMKLLASGDRREKLKSNVRFAELLRTIDIFEPLSNDDLLDLATLLKFEDYNWGFPILQKGEPASNLFIIVSGRVEVMDEDGVTLAEMGRGDVFGEMSLLSGDRVATTIMAIEPCTISSLSQKNFRHVLNRFPALHVFFYKLLVGRITAINLQRAEELTSGMMGQLADIPPVELCQMINSNQKTGRLKLESGQKKADLLFNEGELVSADCDVKEGKEAFYAALAISDGRFKFIHGLSFEEMDLDVIGGFMGMLMEGMQRIDDTAVNG